MEIIIILVLCIAVLLLSIKSILIRSQLKSLSKQLENYENKLIWIELNDKDLEEITHKINLIIDDMNKIRVRSNKERNAQNELITSISHDMRTPLTSVIGYLQLALKSGEYAEKEQNIKIALQRAVYCSQMIDDFFEISVIESRGIEPEPERIDLNEIICEMILANYPTFSAAGITPHFEERSEPIYILFDRKMLERMLQNLISNAVKYSAGDIVFNIETADAIRLTVSNKMNEQEIDTDKIFDKFYQSSNARNGKGTGLGLYICKELINACGGHISAECRDCQLDIHMDLPAYTE